MQLAGGGRTATRTTESSGPAKVKIWQRSADCVMVKLVSSAEVGTSTYALVRSGRGGKTRIDGPIQKAAEDPDIEAFKRMQAEER